MTISALDCDDGQWWLLLCPETGRLLLVDGVQYAVSMDESFFISAYPRADESSDMTASERGPCKRRRTC